MVIKKCLVDSNKQPGMYQISYAPFEPLVKNRGRPSRYYLERKEDPRMPPISLAYIYGNERWVVVERAFIFEEKIYSRVRKFLSLNSPKSQISGDTHHLEANINHLFKKIKLPVEIRTELEKAFIKNGQKLEDHFPAVSSF